MKNFAEFGITVPEILLPKDKDLASWCVIACDQYTQDASYWEKAAAATGGKPSTLSLILPEVYLSAPDKSQRIQKIHETMAAYLSGGVFDAPQHACMYIERRTGYGRIRRGLVTAIDLEAYDWRPGSHAPVRATEATIVERIPPRKEIRRGAPLESPHIMLLVNDPGRLLVEQAGKRARQHAPLYDGDLMLGAGHITGWAVSSSEDLDALHSSLAALWQAGRQPDGSTFLFAVGDGNHSLATAKAVWDEYKEERRAAGEAESVTAASPLRYALVELVNIYDEGLTFEPIHRVLFGADAAALSAYLQSALGGTAGSCPDAASLEAKVAASSATFGFVFRDGDGSQRYEFLESDVRELAVSRLQPALDSFIAGQGGSVTIDYIHGSDEVFRLGAGQGAVAVLLPPVAKDSFFATISASGALPRKSFSMGEASEKRFYLECRRI